MKEELQENKNDKASDIYRQIPQFLIIGLCAWKCKYLFTLYEGIGVRGQFIELAFFLWLVPFFCSLFVTKYKPKNKNFSVAFSIVALLFSQVSNLISLNILGQVAFMLSLMAFFPFSLGTLIWTVGLLSWIPTFGWFCLKLGIEDFVVVLRLMIVLFSVSGFFVFQSKSLKS